MKKLLQLFMVLALVLVTSMCFAQREFPDGTVLNDKEQAVYELVERQSKYFIDPASIKFRAVGVFPDIVLEWYNEGRETIDVCLSAINQMGGRTLKTYRWYKDGSEHTLGSYEGLPHYPDKNGRVDISKLNHLWKTYHCDD